MIELFSPDAAGALATWVAAAATILTWSILIGARRPFTWTQRLLAGMLTGYLALLAIREVLVPRVLTPLADDPAGHPLLLLAMLLAVMLVAARWLPRWVGAMPVSILVGATAAFALSGAMVGTVLPQVVGLLPAPGADPAALAGAVGSVVVASLVLLALLHGRSEGRVVGTLGRAGRWVILGGVGAWLGYLVLSRLVLLSDRLAFLATDWLGLGR